MVWVNMELCFLKKLPTSYALLLIYLVGLLKPMKLTTLFYKKSIKVITIEY